METAAKLTNICITEFDFSMCNVGIKAMETWLLNVRFITKKFFIAFLAHL